LLWTNGVLYQNILILGKKKITLEAKYSFYITGYLFAITNELEYYHELAVEFSLGESLRAPRDFSAPNHTHFLMVCSSPRLAVVPATYREIKPAFICKLYKYIQQMV
jgi:hypothetical protein